VPAAPVNAARDMSPLYQYLDIPEIKNYVDEMARLETARTAAAGRAIDDERLGATANQQRVDYTINQALPMLAQLTRDPSDASLDRLAVGFLSTPGIDRAFAEQRIAEIRSVPPDARPALIADLMNVNPQGRAARAATFPDVRTFNDGTVMGGLPLSDPAALTSLFLNLGINAGADIYGIAGMFVTAKFLILNLTKTFPLGEKRFAHFSYNRSISLGVDNESWKPTIEDLSKMEFGDKDSGRRLKSFGGKMYEELTDKD
jgi:hypothetical protein